MNPLAQIMGKQAMGNLPQMQMIQQFQQFRQMWNPQTARAKINEMLQSGQINAQQLEQAKQMASQMRGLFK